MHAACIQGGDGQEDHPASSPSLGPLSEPFLHLGQVGEQLAPLLDWIVDLPAPRHDAEPHQPRQHPHFEHLVDLGLVAGDEGVEAVAGGVGVDEPVGGPDAREFTVGVSEVSDLDRSVDLLDPEPRRLGESLVEQEPEPMRRWRRLPGVGLRGRRRPPPPRRRALGRARRRLHSTGPARCATCRRWPSGCGCRSGRGRQP